jgi:hypothetical protein
MRFGGAKVNWRGIAPLLAATILGGCSGTHLAQVRMVTPHATVQSVVSSAFVPHSVPDASAVSGYVLSVTSTSPSLATTAADLTQVSKDKDLWQTTVILSQALGKCPGPAGDYWLETTSPDLNIQALRVARTGRGPCRVNVTFKGPPQTPESASLVLDEAGVLSSTPLSLSRDVTSFEYVGVPAIFGAAMILALLLTIVLFVRIYDGGGSRIFPFSPPFWHKTIPVSERLKVGAMSVVTILGTFLGTATLASSLFPGVSLGLFVILSIIAGAIAALSSVVYSMLYDRKFGDDPLQAAGTTLAFDSNSDERPIISVPFGAVIKVTGNPKIAGAGGQAIPLASGEVPVPSDTDIEITGKSLDFPGDSDVLVKGRCSFRISSNGTLPYPGGALNFPVTIEADTDTTITYSGDANLKIPCDAKAIRGSRHATVKGSTKIYRLTSDHDIKPVANMVVAVVPVLITMFAIGAELGLVAVLAHFSEATVFGRFIAYDLIVAVAIFTLYYGVAPIRTAADS